MLTTQSRFLASVASLERRRDDAAIESIAASQLPKLDSYLLLLMRYRGHATRDELLRFANQRSGGKDLFSPDTVEDWSVKLKAGA